MAKDKVLFAEVVYCPSAGQEFACRCSIAQGWTVKDVVAASGVLRQFPDINLDTQSIGIFSKICSLSHLVNDGDRVEIYRPLASDAKTARRRRASIERLGRKR